ncbi:MAG: TPM domain-containing protein [Rhodoferax sp.]|nr:TPM domain-containing protein [Rhodoferax sp.]
MDISRLVKHLFFSERRTARAFLRQGLAAIEAAIQASEASHAGEICFAVEGGLDGLPLFNGQTARERAIEVFSQLRVWDTAHNNGVLIYVLLADQAVEIVADRGIHAYAGDATWEAICQQMERAFARADYQGGAREGIEAVAACLRDHFPHGGHRANELSNAPVVFN